MKRCADSANLDWYEGAALLSLDSFAIVGGALRVGRIFNRYPAFVVSGNSRDLGKGTDNPRVTLGACRRSCCEMDGCLK